MTENNPKKLRFQLLELFPNAQGDITKRTGMVSRKIKYTNPKIHPIYGLGWYALVEQLFIHNQSDQLQNMIDFLKNIDNFGLKLHPSQQTQIKSTIIWLEDIVKTCLNQDSIDYNNFKSIYSTLFYTRVFKEYAEEQSQLNSQNLQPFYLEDVMSLVGSFFIIKEFYQRLQNKELNQEEYRQLHINLLQLTGDDNFYQNDQYLTGIDQNRVMALSFFYNLGMRVYQDINGYIQTFIKVKENSQNTIIFKLGVILCNEDNYCIAYDSTLEVQYQLFFHYKQRKKRVAINTTNLTAEIQEKKKHIEQLQHQELKEFQEKLSQLLLLLNQNKAEASELQQKEADLEASCLHLEKRIQELVENGNKIQQEIKKKEILKNNREYVGHGFYSNENQLLIQYQNNLILKRQAAQNEQLLLQKQNAEYLAKNKNIMEETNLRTLKDKYAQLSKINCNV